MKISHLLSEKSHRQQCKQLLPNMLPITWHLTQQLLAKARVLFTRHYTSAVHKHNKTHSVIPAHTTKPLEKITEQPLPAVIMVYCVCIKLYEWLQADSVSAWGSPAVFL